MLAQVTEAVRMLECLIHQHPQAVVCAMGAHLLGYVLGRLHGRRR
jgi:hypothetical protein